MNDREMLEMAAKAAGLVYEGFSGSLEDSRGPGLGLWSSSNGYSYWNPLTNDGDALRLAVDLGLQFYGREIGASVEGYAFVDEADCMGDKYLAARRAIVLAAAEIGRLMR